MMKKQFCIRLSLIVVIAILLSDTGTALYQHKKEFQTTEYSQIQIMSCQDIASLTGGSAGGGTCEDYTSDCYGCTPLSASNCQGSSGSCTNNCHMAICKCGSYFIFIHGCM